MLDEHARIGLAGKRITFGKMVGHKQRSAVVATHRESRVSLLSKYQGIESNSALTLGVHHHWVQVDFGDHRFLNKQVSDDRDDFGRGSHIERRRAAECTQQRCAFQQVQLPYDCVKWQIWGEQTEVLVDFRGNAAEACQNNRAPFWIVSCSHNQLDATLSHTLDQHAVEHKAGAVIGDIAMEALPTLFKRHHVRHVQNDSAGIAFVIEVGGLGLENYRVSQLFRCGNCPLKICYKTAFRKVNSERRQDFFGTVFRYHTGAQMMADARKLGGIHAPEIATHEIINAFDSSECAFG